LKFLIFKSIKIFLFNQNLFNITIIIYINNIKNFK